MVQLLELQDSPFSLGGSRYEQSGGGFTVVLDTVELVFIVGGVVV